MVFEIHRSALPVFLFFQSVFSFIFTLLFPALYNDLCVKWWCVIWSHCLPGNRRQNKKKQPALWCYNAHAVTNNIADFAPLIL